MLPQRWQGALGDFLKNRFQVSLFITSGLLQTIDACFCLGALYVSPGHDGLIWFLASCRQFFNYTAPSAPAPQTI